MSTRKMSYEEVQRCAHKLAARLFQKAWIELSDVQQEGLILAIREIEQLTLDVQDRKLREVCYGARL